MVFLSRLLVEDEHFDVSLAGEPLGMPQWMPSAQAAMWNHWAALR